MTPSGARALAAPAVAALLTLFAASAPEAVAALRAGAAVVTIDAAAGVPLAGWAERGDDARAEGVRESLEARALVLEGAVGRPRVGLVAVDTFAAWPGLRETVASQAASLELDALLVVATGTRSGADGGRPELLQVLAAACNRALRDAAEALEPARVGTGEARAPGISRNASSPGALVDERVPIVRVDAVEGGAIGTVFSFAAQPAVLSAANRALSPDYPRHARRRLEAVRGGVAIWLPGAIASQVPNVGGLERRRGDLDFELEAATALGNSLGLVVAAAAPMIAMSEEAPLAVRRSSAALPEEIVALRLGGLRVLFAPIAASAGLVAELRARSGEDLLLVSNAGASLGALFAAGEADSAAPYHTGPRLGEELAGGFLDASAELLRALR